MTPTRTPGSFEELLLAELLEVHGAMCNDAPGFRSTSTYKQAGPHIPASVDSKPERAVYARQAHSILGEKRRRRLGVAIGAVAAVVAAAAIVAVLNRPSGGPAGVTTATVGGSSATSVGTPVPRTPSDLAATVIQLMKSEMNIAFPANAIENAQAASSQAKQELLSANPGSHLLPSGRQSLFVVGGRQKDGREVSFLAITYSLGTWSSASDSSLNAGAQRVTRPGDCTVWERDRPDPRGTGIMRSIEVHCPAGMIEVILASPSAAAAVTAAQVQSLAVAAFRGVKSNPPSLDKRVLAVLVKKIAAENGSSRPASAAAVATDRSLVLAQEGDAGDESAKGQSVVFVQIHGDFTTDHGPTRGGGNPSLNTHSGGFEPTVIEVTLTPDLKTVLDFSMMQPGNKTTDLHALGTVIDIPLGSRP